MEESTKDLPSKIEESSQVFPFKLEESSEQFLLTTSQNRGDWEGIPFKMKHSGTDSLAT